MTIDDIDIVELNEAFAAQVIPCRDELGIDPERAQPVRRRDRARPPVRDDRRADHDHAAQRARRDRRDLRPGDHVRGRRDGPGDDRGAIELNRILFVCMGNICRSPTAEGVMRALVREAGLEDEFEIDSAGTGSWHAGDPPDRRATAAAQARGVTLEGAARQVRPRDFEHFDLLLAMDRENLRELRTFSRRTATSAGKAQLLREFDPASAGAATSTCPTPTTAARTASRQVLDQVEAACRGLLESSARGEPRARSCAPPPAATVRAVERVGGGDINEAFRVQFVDESFAFVKTRADVAPGEYAAEAAGLRWLARARRAARAGGARRGRRGARARLGRRGRARRRRGVRRGPGGGARGGRGRVRRDAAAAGLAPRRVAGGRRDAADGFGRASAPLRPRRSRRPAASSRVALAPQRPHSRLAHVLRRAAPAARCCPTPASTRFGNRAVERVCDRHGGARRAARAARAAARRPVERERAVGARRHALADRSGGLRRPSRGRSRDAAAVRLARPALPRRLRGAVARWRRATRSASRSTSCSRCSSTRRCSAAATQPRPSAWPAATPLRPGRRRCS